MTSDLIERVARAIDAASKNARLGQDWEWFIPEAQAAIAAMQADAEPVAETRFYIDCEFDGHDGPLLSIALVKDNGSGIHIATTAEAFDPWVIANVVPLIDRHDCRMAVRCLPNEVGAVIRTFIDCDNPIIVADSPVDIGRFCRAISTGPDGQWASAEYPSMRFEVHNVDCYPTTLKGAVQHNAWWDAMALKAKLDNRVSTSSPVDDRAAPNTSVKLRDAVEVAAAVIEYHRPGSLLKGVDAIEADREAVRAEQAAELAKFKALAETLAEALETFAEEWDERDFLAKRHRLFYREASKAIAEYKEARDV